MKIYLAAPLFNESEIERNKKVKDFLENLGYEVYLPQDESGLAYDMINDKRVMRRRLWRRCRVFTSWSGDL